MNLLTHISVLFFFLSADTITAFSRSNVVKVPWSNPSTGETFRSNFIDAVLASGQFPEQEREDLEFLLEILLTTISNVQPWSRNAEARLHALNMALAASMAYIVVEEGEGLKEQKVKAISEALTEAFRRSTGFVNTAFINEIKAFANLFSEEEQFNEIQNENPNQQEYSGLSVQSGSSGSYGALGSASSLASSAIPSAASQVSSSATSTTATTASAKTSDEFSALEATKSQTLALSLASSPAFNSIYEGFKSLSEASAFTKAAVLSGAIAGGIEYNIASIMSEAAAAAAAQVAVGSGASAYADAVSSAIAQVYADKGLLTASNAYVTPESLAPYLSIALSSAASATSNAASGRTAAAADSLSSSSSTSIISNTATSQSSAATSSGTAWDATASEVTTSFARTLIYFLLQNAGFESIFGTVSSSAAAGTYASSLTKSAATAIGLGNFAPVIGSAAASAAASIIVGDGAYPYAQAIASSVAQALWTCGVLNSANADSLASEFGSALLTRTTSSASESSESMAASVSSSAVSQSSFSATSSTVDGSPAVSSWASGAAGGASGGTASQQPSGFGEYGGPGQPFAPSSPTISPILALFSSPAGLTSPAASQRVSLLIPTLLSAVSPSGLDISLFSNGLSSLVSQISQSGAGLSAPQIVVEALLEVLCAVIHIASEAQIGAVSTDIAFSSATRSAIAQSIYSAFSA